MDPDAAVEAARADIRAAVAALRAADARTETLAEYVADRKLFGVPRPPVLRAIGEVWRLGVLLLDAEGGVRATGEVLTIADPGAHNSRSRVVEARHELRIAAQRGHIAEGTVVCFDAPVLDLDVLASGAVGPLALTADGVGVHWSPHGANTVPLGRYLAERVELLAHPPQGAT